ncbi:MAG: histidine kinase [Hyphomicrobium sp.]
MSLRKRLLLKLFAVLGVSLLIAAALAYWRAAAKVRTELHAALTVGEQVLLDAVKEIERAPSPYQQMRIVIERFSGGRHLKIALIDSSGARIAESRLEAPDDPAPHWFYTMVAGAPEAAHVALPTSIHGYSEFLIEADPRNEVQEFWEELGYGLVVVSILSGLASLLIFWNIGRELRPLQDLNKALSGIAEGDFSMRIAEAGSSDLRAVGNGFNEMARRLDATQASNTRLEVQLSTVQEEERAELARDLHDEIGPLLFSVGLDAAEVQRILTDSGQTEPLDRLESIRDSVRLSQKKVLQILGRLRSGTVEDLGLEGAITQLVEFWKTRQPHIAISIDVPESGLGYDLDPVAYRIVQESISNSVRHGNTSRIDVMIAMGPDSVTRVTVSDDGGGLKSTRQGNGLIGMRERVSSRNGTLTVKTRGDERGTLVAADFPSPGTAPDRTEKTTTNGTAPYENSTR